jgi:hypothetical protein
LLILTLNIVVFTLMATTEEIDNGIAEILKTPNRDFHTHPLTQPEVIGIIEFLVNEVNDESVLYN